ncbi:MAG: FKBP-type peptidyl-prolyl cis-trans isomerase [Draconibacterium sp.]|nr:FKBP-type peptidyl-prolyl cis-trans isomerase [Draconibacterium sp.]
MLEIGKYAMVTLTYDLHVDDENGEMIEQATETQPLEFLYGAGAMLPKFESQLAGLREGEPFTIKLSKNDAYGEVNEEAVVFVAANRYFDYWFDLIILTSFS